MTHVHDAGLIFFDARFLGAIGDYRQLHFSHHFIGDFLVVRDMERAVEKSNCHEHFSIFGRYLNVAVNGSWPINRF
jgi:hypothetical protein